MGGDSPLDNDDPEDGVTGGATRLQEFFLPIHGYVRLRPEEIAIVDHPAFQRLRLCRQLGFAHLVFPAAVHTRFEHSIGAVYVAEKIVQYVNFNYKSHPRDRMTVGNYRICKLDNAAKRLIRLGALLHDIGHVPFGHTLEDELEHLEKHDGEARVDLLAKVPYRGHVVDSSLQLKLGKPDEGWSLEGLINEAYNDVVHELFSQSEEKLTAYDVVKLITLKAPAAASAAQQSDVVSWKRRKRILSKVLPVGVCRDIIGNTICADFLDYIFRDWYHVGKPMTEDRRLYQYMEVRAPHQSYTDKATQQFVINVGPDQKLRHDALTCIFELLEGRYKLAETVLFHRTKPAMTALLDRCFLELRHLYQSVGLKGRKADAGSHLAERALGLLLKSGDDQLSSVVRQLAEGVDEDRVVLERARKRYAAHVKASAASPVQDRELPRLALTPEDDGVPLFDVSGQRAFIEELSRRLENRTMYTLACRLPRRALHWTDRDETTRESLPAQLRSLADPDVRRRQIVMIEKLLNLEPGSITLYAPPSAKMNAKIAQVKLLIDGQILPFSEYEKRRGDQALTGGVLAAQVRRFHELWGVSIYINRPQWHLYAEHAGDILSELEHLLRHSVYMAPQDMERKNSIRQGFEPVIAKARVATNRGEPLLNGSPVDEHSTHSTGLFISGLPYSCD